MRLLFVHDHRFLTGPDGEIRTVGSFPRSIWQRYLANFDEIVVVARDGGAVPADSDLARSDLAKVRFSLIGDFPVVERLLGVPGTASRMIKQELKNADALLVRLPSDLGNLAARLAMKRETVWAGEIVGCALDGYGNHGSLASRIYAPIAMRRLQRLAAQSDQMLYVTQRFLQERYPSPNDTVGVSDVEIIAPDADEIAKRHERLTELANGRAPVFGTVASLRIMSKGIQDVLSAVKQLRDNGLPVQYRVLGAGDHAPWIGKATQKGVADLVHFDGTRPSGTGVRAWLDDIDVHLQPSYQEGLPRATVEAMNRGCACLGSTAGGLPELIPAHRTHTPGDIGALAALITEYATHPALISTASVEDTTKSRLYLPENLDIKRTQFYQRMAKRADEAA